MTNNNININASEKNTKNELLGLISKLKKTEILDMIDNYNRVNMKNNKIKEKNISIKIEKKKLKIPKNLNKIQLKNRKLDNEYYKNI